LRFCLAQQAERGCHFAEIVVAAPKCCEMRGVGFHGDAEFEAALDVGNGFHARETERLLLCTHLHETACALSRNNQAIFTQPAERFTQHRARDIEHISKLMLAGQLLVRRIIAIGDALREFAIDLVDK
jgi:hypothetical protein